MLSVRTFSANRAPEPEYDRKPITICLTPVFRRPVKPDWQTELVSLAGSLSVEGKVPNLTGAPPLHLLFHPGMGDHELAVVEDIVAHEVVEEVGKSFDEFSLDFCGQGVDLLERLGMSPCVI